MTLIMNFVVQRCYIDAVCEQMSQISKTSMKNQMPISIMKSNLSFKGIYAYTTCANTYILKILGLFTL